MLKRSIILSPHFDDAVLSLGGLLTQSASHSKVVTFCAGKPEKPVLKAWDRDSGFVDSNDAMYSRTEENRQSLACLGIPEQNIVNYAYLDSQYQTRLQLATDNQFDAIKAEVAQLIESHATDEVAFYAPGLEKHRDHKNVKLAFLNSIRENRNLKHSFYLYQDLPYADDLINQGRTGNRVVNRGGLEVLRNTILRDLHGEEEIIELSENEITRKIVAIEMYKSQVKPLKEFSGIDMVRVAKDFAANQARALCIPAPYCEVVYKITH